MPSSRDVWKDVDNRLYLLGERLVSLNEKTMITHEEERNAFGGELTPYDPWLEDFASSLERRSQGKSR
jgi:hypothetical protein